MLSLSEVLRPTCSQKCVNNCIMYITCTCIIIVQKSTCWLLLGKNVRYFCPTVILYMMTWHFIYHVYHIYQYLVIVEVQFYHMQCTMYHDAFKFHEYPDCACHDVLTCTVII